MASPDTAKPATAETVNGLQGHDRLGEQINRTDTAAVTKTQAPRWRDHIPIHPAADLFPPLPPNELKALGEDIKKNGVKIPIALKEVYLKDENGCVSLSTKYEAVIDGRNRLDAAELVGLEVIKRGKLNPDLIKVDWPDIEDPYDYVLSVNLHRRHLTAEQKRELIARVLKAKPETSNNQIAKQIKVTTDKTVASVRQDLESRSEIPNLGNRTDAKGRKQPARKMPRLLVADETTRKMRWATKAETDEAVAFALDPAAREAAAKAIWEKPREAEVEEEKQAAQFVTARWKRDANAAEIARTILGVLKYEPHDTDLSALKKALESVGGDGSPAAVIKAAADRAEARSRALQGVCVAEAVARAQYPEMPPELVRRPPRAAS